MLASAHVFVYGYTCSHLTESTKVNLVNGLLRREHLNGSPYHCMFPVQTALLAKPLLPHHGPLPFGNKLTVKSLPLFMCANSHEYYVCLNWQGPPPPLKWSWKRKLTFSFTSIIAGVKWSTLLWSDICFEADDKSNSSPRIFEICIFAVAVSHASAVGDIFKDLSLMNHPEEIPNFVDFSRLSLCRWSGNGGINKKGKKESVGACWRRLITVN